MWFDTLVLQLRLHMAYRVNGILYRLRFLSLSYESGFAKTLGLVLAILRELLGLLLGKLLYMAAFFAAPLLLFPSEPPAGLYGHLLLFLTLIGGIFNSKLLDAEQDVYYAVFLLRSRRLVDLPGLRDQPLPEKIPPTTHAHDQPCCRYHHRHPGHLHHIIHLL